MKTRTLRLTLDVTFESDDGKPLDSQTVAALTDNLRAIPDDAAGHGLMSQGTIALVTEWHATVEERS